MMASGQGADAAIEIIKSVGTGTTPKLMFDPRLAKTVWQAYTTTAEHYNEPGHFTALIGYEWTSNKAGNNLHRVIIFRDGKEKADQIVPFRQRTARTLRSCGTSLISYQAKTGGSVLAIPHNGNLSNGRMFALVDFDGRGLTREYAETRARVEPVYEVTQMKGDGKSRIPSYRRTMSLRATSSRRGAYFDLNGAQEARDVAI